MVSPVRWFTLTDEWIGIAKNQDSHCTGSRSDVASVGKSNQHLCSNTSSWKYLSHASNNSRDAWSRVTWRRTRGHWFRYEDIINPLNYKIHYIHYIQGVKYRWVVHYGCAEPGRVLTPHGDHNIPDTVLRWNWLQFNDFEVVRFGDAGAVATPGIFLHDCLLRP